MEVPFLCVYLFMRPAWISSCARSWLTTAQAEPTMKCKMTSQRSMAYWSRLFMSRAWRSGPRALPSSTQDLILWMNTKPSLSFCKEKKRKVYIKYISYWLFFSKDFSVKPLEQPRHRLFKWISSITDNCACNTMLLLLFFMTGYINHSNTRLFTKPVTLRSVNTTNRNILTLGIYGLSSCICWTSIDIHWNCYKNQPALKRSRKTYPPKRAFFSLSLNTGFKMYPRRPPCSCWLCQRRSPAKTEIQSSWSLQGDANNSAGQSKAFLFV